MISSGNDTLPDGTIQIAMFIQGVHVHVQSEYFTNKYCKNIIFTFWGVSQEAFNFFGFFLTFLPHSQESKKTTIFTELFKCIQCICMCTEGICLLSQQTIFFNFQVFMCWQCRTK